MLAKALLLVLCVCSTLAYSKSVIEFTGTAYDIDSEKMLYREQHRINVNEAGEYLSSEVRYSGLDGNIIAIKTLDFSKSQTMPQLTFIDKRVDSNIKVDPLNGDAQNTVRIFSERGEARKLSQVKISSSASSIIDAGFDLFVIKNWQPLLAGKTIGMDFLALTRAQYIGFELEAVSSKGRSDGLLVLSLRPSSFFIRLLMDPIYLTYDINSRRLLRFEGLTNIENVEGGQDIGDNFVARIEYSYP